MNPYTYILNNPLSGVDPSGYRFISYVANAIRLGGRFAKRGLRRLTKPRSKQRATSGPPETGPNFDVPSLPPTMPQPSNPTGPTTTTSPAIETFGSSTTSPVADQSTPNNTANDSGLSSQGIIMANQENDTSNTEGKTSGERLDDLIGSSTKINENTNGMIESEITDGEFDNPFDALDSIGGQTVLDKEGLKVNELDDGRKIIARNRSTTDGRPTLEVQKIKQNGRTKTTNEIRFGKSDSNKVTTGSNIPDKFKR
jgi:hypothetical protein